ncbi:ATP/GTP-binding protein [Bifidobacterium margollesii]|uniref:ATP/GTP-binding protein n=1 Tax=Bifidobacterium margollesii TaxID=2020964 RepID=A0A2N5JD81_9BIFI|nr:ATP-binding protein [Bifidobacterium margollesii]PLS32145.1 ATP/GTP-binding protein [Bifidobacterium margollesii]
MLKRKISSALLDWKNNPNHKSLLIQGARQVGKTFIVDQFAHDHYDHYVSLNFEEQTKYRDIFNGDNDIDHITARIMLAKPGSTFVPGKTLLFLDEIQSCPNARTTLKFLTMDGRYDVIASGSLLGINYGEVSSFPVGYVERLTLHSLDFEEFLWGLGVSETVIQYVKSFYDNRTKVDESIHAQMMEYLRQYIVIGGMPAVVQKFLESHDYLQALAVQRDILADYEDDIAKYAKDSEKAKARACFLSIPNQLARDSKRFTYSVVEKGSNARKYGGSLQWLYDAGIINFCHRLEIPELPLEGNADNTKFKVYMRDTGLLVAMLEDGSQKDILDGNLGIYKGAIYENIVGDIFAKNGKRLYYFERNSKLEMDFFIRYQGMATAVEVKSSANRQAKSMRSMIDNYGVQHGIKLSPGNMGMAGDKVEVMPLYMAMFL